MSLMKQLLDGLNDPDILEGDRTLLDNSLVLWTSEFSDPASHCSAGIPLLMAGSVGGQFRTGRHLNYNIPAQSNPNTFAYETRDSTHNVFTSILNAFGYDDDHFGGEVQLGESQFYRGPISGLT